MKTKKIFLALSLIVSVGLLTQCEKYGGRGGIPDPDEDSDRPEWAGGDTDANDHIKGNDDSGSTRGGDYGDLYELWRTEDGVPIMWQEPTTLEYYVQPVGINSLGDPYPLPLNEEGELDDPTLATGVEFGRLNIVRSPTSVLDQALSEALKALAAPGAEITLDFCGRLTSTYDDGTETIVKTIDSPRENMAIYRTIMQDLTDVRLAFLFGDPYYFDPLTIAASCFAAGSDKTGTVNIDEVVYINGFMECTGNNEILNLHDLDFSNEQNYYYNFTEPMLGEAQFQYNRGVYATRNLEITTLDGNGNYTIEVETVLDAMENRGLFTHAWGGSDLTQVEGFACAIDDAVQVLDFVHESDLVVFLPD